jgi:hypothetical protein
MQEVSTAKEQSVVRGNNKPTNKDIAALKEYYDKKYGRK